MGFLNPNAFLFASLYAVLIALYLWERYRRHVEVPSLLLWEAVPEASVRTSRFRPDLVFLLQLLLLTLLIAGLAQPYLAGRAGPGPSARRVFILDTSASMQAREGRLTRFEEARQALRDRLSALAASDEVMLIAAANHPRVVASFSRDRAATMQALDKVEPVDTGTNLDLALAIAQRAAARRDRPATIEVFTDTAPPQLPPAWRERVGFVQVGESDDNLGIAGLQVLQGRFQDHREARAHVVVRNFSHREAHGFLTVQLDGDLLSRRGFSVPARSARGFPVGDFPHPGILHVRLEVDDALAADNHAYAWIRPARTMNILVVSEPSPLTTELQAIAAATGNLAFRFLSPADYTPAAADSADVVIFHRFVPPREPKRARLYIFPATSGQWLTLRGEVAELPVIDWNDEHAVMRALRPPVALPLLRAQVLDRPPWADALLSSRSGGQDVPLAFAGERDGYRIACIAFDLAAERLLAADHVDWLLLFLNLLDWLGPADSSVSVLHTGEIQILDDLPPRPRRIIDPRAKSTIVPAGARVELEALYAGEYRVSADGHEQRVFANFFDPAESDIGRPAKPAPKAAPVAAQPALSAGPEASFSPWVYAAALVLFLIEWFAAARQT